VGSADADHVDRLMPTVSIGDAEIYYEEAGAGEPLLLVPGLGGQGAFWNAQVEAFKRDFRVIVHDHRGAGRSTLSPIKYSVEQMADDTLRLMDALRIDSAHLVGHSTGGAIGQVIALEQPARLRSLVLSATWAGPDPYFRRLFEGRKEVLLTQGIEAYLRASVLVLAPPDWVSRNDAALTELHRAQAAASAPREILASRIDAIVAFDRRAQLARIRTPTLVIVAQDDMVTPRFYSDELAKAVPGARYVVLDDGGHFVPQIVPQTYNLAVANFLASQRRRS
jgi:aminoacrylate hydrolase